MSCPKCNGTMSGPKYISDESLGERLLYVCQRCGYQLKDLCADAKEGIVKYEFYLQNVHSKGQGVIEGDK